LDAEHFRERAARAREMAQFGDDLRISQMLLEVARDMDAEAVAIDAGRPNEQRRSPRHCPTEVYRATLHRVGDTAVARPVQIIDLSFGGARLRCECAHIPGTRVVLDIPSRGLRLTGRIIRVRGIEAAMVFSAEAKGDPILIRLLRSLLTAARASDVNKPDVNKPDLNKPDLNKPDLNKIVKLRPSGLRA
jgi:hypothetical protein